MYEYMNVAMHTQYVKKRKVCIFILKEHADDRSAWHKKDCKYVK